MLFRSVVHSTVFGGNVQYMEVRRGIQQLAPPGYILVGCGQDVARMWQGSTVPRRSLSVVWLWSGCGLADESHSWVQPTLSKSSLACRMRARIVPDQQRGKPTRGRRYYKLLCVQYMLSACIQSSEGRQYVLSLSL